MPDDLYTLWLKVPPGVRPPDHYALLGLPRFCADVEKIEAAAHARLDALDRYALHPDLIKREACQQFMNEVARARVVLINPQKRSAYDLTLKPAKAEPPAGVAQVKRKPAAPVVPIPLSPAAPTKAAAIVGSRWRKPDRRRWIGPGVAALLAGTIVTVFIHHRNNAPPAPAAGADQPLSHVSSPVTSPVSSDARLVIAATVHLPGRSPPLPSGSSTSVKPTIAASSVPAPSPIGTVRDTPAAAMTRAPTSPVASPPRDRLPSAAEREAGRKMVDEVFAADIAKAVTPGDKASLAKRMVVVAAKTDDTPSGRFVLLSDAGDLATDAGDADTALAAIDQMAQHFPIDALKFKTRALIVISRLPTTGRRDREWAGQFDGVIAAAMATDRYDLAREAAEAASSAASDVQDQSWLHSVQQRISDISYAEAEFQKLAPFRVALANDPADANANFRVGSFRCFVKEDWPAGLPMLALGSDPAARSLAMTELGSPANPGALVELADGWWSFSASRPPSQRPPIKRHAVNIYSRVVSRTSGRTRSHVQQRLEEAADATGQ